MNTTGSRISALIRAAGVCIGEADRARRLGQHRYAAELRASARHALAEVNALQPPMPVDPDPETAKRQEQARIHAAVILKGLH
jgi:hypothetical protein